MLFQPVHQMPGLQIRNRVASFVIPKGHSVGELPEELHGPVRTRRVSVPPSAPRTAPFGPRPTGSSPSPPRCVTFRQVAASLPHILAEDDQYALIRARMRVYL